MSATEELEHTHRLIDRMLAILEAAAKRVEAAKEYAVSIFFVERGVENYTWF